MMARQFAGREDVGYVSVGTVVDLSNPDESFDGMHLTPKGNTAVAAALAPVVSELMARTGRP